MQITPDFRQELRCEGLAVSFPDESQCGSFRAIDDIDLVCEPGFLHVITGPSGSGKSTLLHVLSGLLTSDAGTVRWGGQELSELSEPARDAWRRKHVGLVFQSFNLIRELGSVENVLLPVWFGQWRAGKPARARAAALLETLGVPSGRGRVLHLSRGEQQRVALARALVFEPAIILADEPTASLDATASVKVVAILEDLARNDHRNVIAVSHDPALIEAADVLINIERGRTAPAPETATAGGQ